MPTVRNQIVETLKKVTDEGDIHLEVPEIESHGDLSTNIAMQLVSDDKRATKDKK
ncbi:MAG: hypothetical protein ACXADB_01015, partial [Candidatus Hermodarchaeia archaeon]